MTKKTGRTFDVRDFAGAVVYSRAEVQASKALPWMRAPAVYSWRVYFGLRDGGCVVVAVPSEDAADWLFDSAPWSADLDGTGVMPPRKRSVRK